MSRMRYVLLVFLTAGNIGVASICNVIGTTMLELECHYKSDLWVLSTLFLPVGLGCVMGSLLTHIFIKVMDMYILLVLAMVIYGIGISIMALTSFISLALVGAFMSGFAYSVVFIGNIHSCNVVFPEETYPLHILAVGITVGSLLTPLLAEPFLRTTNSSKPIYLSQGNSSLTQLGYGYATNHTNVTGFASCDETVSSITYLYILLGLLNVPCIGGLLWLFVMSRKDNDLIIPTAETTISKYENIGKPHLWKQIVLVASLMSLLSVLGSLSYVYGNYLIIISEDGPLHFGAVKAATITFVFWLMNCIGRMTNTALSLCMKQTTLLYINMLMSLASAVEVMVTADEKSEVYFWIGTVSLGFFLAPLLPGVIAWSRNFISLTPFIIGLFTVADVVGFALFPFIGGQLLYEYKRRSLLYFNLGLCTFQMFFFVGIHCCGRYVSQH